MLEFLVSLGEVPALSKNVYRIMFVKCYHFVPISISFIAQYNSVQVLH